MKKATKKLVVTCALMAAAMSAAALPPPPPKASYDYYVYNALSKKDVAFYADFSSGPRTGTVAHGGTTHVYGEGYGTSSLTLGDSTDPAGECVVTNSGGTHDHLKRQADGTQGFTCVLAGPTVVLTPTARL